MKAAERSLLISGTLACVVAGVLVARAQESIRGALGREVSIEHHLQDGEEFEIPVPDLVKFGERLFEAKFTIQEGAGRPLSKGTGAAISDPSSPLVFPRKL